MPSNYTGNTAAAFSSTLPMVVDGDSPAAQLWRVPEQALLDNDCVLRTQLLSQRILRLRPLEYASAPSTNFIAAVADSDNKQVVLVHGFGGGRLADGDHVAVGGAIPTGTGTAIANAAARSSSSNRIVAVGGAGIANKSAYSDDNGATWTSGGSLSPDGQAIVWDPTHSKFIVLEASTAAHADYSTDGTSWTDVALTWTGSGGGGLAMLSNGHCIACGGGTPQFQVSADGGATWAATGGTVPSAASYSDGGWVVGDGGSTIWHIGTLSNQTIVCSSTDGITWTRVLAQTWSANPSTNPVIYRDGGAGLLVAVSHLSNSTTGFVASLDGGVTWLPPTSVLGATVFAHSYALAGGRLFSTDGAGVFRASDGIDWS